MKAVKILSKFFAVILAILFGFTFLIFMTFLFTRDLLSENSIDKYVEASEVFNTKSEEVFYEEGTNKTIKTEIQEELSKINIPSNITEEVLNSEEVDDILSTYTSNYINYILVDDKRPSFPSNQLLSIVNQKLEKYKLILTTKETKFLENYIETLGKKIDSSMPSVYQLNNMGYDMYGIRLLSTIIFSTEAVLGLIFVLILITILIGICLWNKLKAIRSISIPIILVGVIFIAGAFAEVKILNMMMNGKGLIDGLILNVMSKSYEKLLIYGIALMIIGIILLIISSILIKKSKQKSDQLLETVINDSIAASTSVKDNLKDHIVDENTLINQEPDIIPEEKLPDTIEDEKYTTLTKLEETTTTDSEIPEINISETTTKEEVSEVTSIPLEEPSANMFVKEEEPEEKENKEQENNKPIEDKKIEIENQEEEPINMNQEEIEIVEPDLKEMYPAVKLPKHEEEPEIIEMETIEENQESEKEKEPYDSDKYIEMDETVEEVEKKDIKVKPFTPIDINLVSPKKGKDIEVNLDEQEDEEDIEIL